MALKRLLMSVLLCVSAEQQVDERGHVGNRHGVIAVYVGGRQVDGAGIATQQVVDECGHVGDADVAVHVDVTDGVAGLTARLVAEVHVLHLAQGDGRCALIVGHGDVTVVVCHFDARYRAGHGRAIGLGELQVAIGLGAGADGHQGDQHRYNCLLHNL